MDPRVIEKAYRDLYRIRQVEREVARVYPSDKVKSPVHLSIGQEAIPVAVCHSLQHEDIVFGTYRCHAQYLAKGGSLRGMVAELYGKHTGCAKGKAGSMHLIDMSAGVMGASAVVATTIPQAVGYALGLEMQGRKELVVCFMGDGATEEGVFHESMSYAKLRELPVLFVCENNALAVHSKVEARSPLGSNIANFVKAYGIRTRHFPHMDFFELRTAFAEEIGRLRSERKGPSFVEVRCYRWLEHVGPAEDFNAGYRDRAEGEPWFEKDAVKVVGEALSIEARTRIETEVNAEIADAFQFADDSPFPPASELYTDLFK
jgi:TPP-dependent pyruvate/acetoin dehydrogenase alpha subunit